MNSDDGEEIDIGVVKAKEVIEMSFDAFGADFLEPAVKAPIDFVEVVPEGSLTPAESFLAGEDKTEAACEGSVFVNVEVATAKQGVGRGRLTWGCPKGSAVGALADASSAGVAPTD